MKKTALKIMMAAGVTAVLMTGCFGSKQAPAAPADAATTAAAESAAESAAADQKDSAAAEKKEDAGAEKKEDAAAEKKEETKAEAKEGTAAEESKAADESGAAGETAAGETAADGASAGTQAGTSALLKSAASTLEKQAAEVWGAYGKADVNVNSARNLMIVTLHRDGLTDETIRNLSEEDWRALTSKAQQLSAQYKDAVNKMGLKDFHVGVEIVDSTGAKDYLKVVDGNVDYDAWSQIALEHAAAAQA
ncbi:MAG: hypothetical protein IKH70_06615, partial [Stomatobaculum sp.]|nr:hypothetical protein [Stomatobaculum sp.]